MMYKISCNKVFNDEKNQLLSKGIDQISNDLDIFLMLDKIKEIEKMKKVIFDKNQLILFNFFPKSEISISD